VTSRARAVGRVARPKLAAEATARKAEARSRRDVYFRGEGRLDTPVYDRQEVDSITGPAIVEEWTTTIVVPPGWSARSDELGNLTLERI
jgi:N-methylhydantoinase A